MSEVDYKSRLTQICDFDIVRRNGNFSSMEYVDGIEDNKAFTFSKERVLFENQSPKFEINSDNLNESIPIYLLQDGEQEVAFSPKYSGEYTFNIPNQSSIMLGDVTSDTFYLNANQRYVFKIINLSEDKIIGELNCNIPSQQLPLIFNLAKGHNRIIKYIADESGYKHLRCLSSSVTVKLIDSNNNEIVSSNDGNLYHYFTKGQSYYLYFVNSLDNDITVELQEVNIKNISAMDNYVVGVDDKVLNFTNSYGTSKQINLLIDSNDKSRSAHVYNSSNELISNVIINSYTKIVTFTIGAGEKCYIVFTHNDGSIKANLSFNQMSILWLIDGVPKPERIITLSRHDKSERPNGYKIELYTAENGLPKNKINTEYEIFADNENLYNFDGEYLKIPYYGEFVPNITRKIHIYPIGYSGLSLSVTIGIGRKDIVYTITFDKQGGSGGTDSATAIWNEDTPHAEAPYKTGYIFGGYFSEPNGNGEMYYDENMVAVNKQWQEENNKYLYAKWTAIKYKITFHTMGDVNFDSIAYAEYGKDMPEYNYFPNKKGYEFEGFYDDSGVQYYKMHLVNDEQGAILNYVDTYLRESAVSSRKWNQTRSIELYGRYKLLTCTYEYPRTCPDCGSLPSGSMFLIHGVTYNLSDTIPAGHNWHCWDFITSQTMASGPTYVADLYRSPNDGKIYPNPRFFAVYNEQSCIAQGTLITLADGRQVPVESLKGDEQLLVWNMLTGKLDSARIMFIDKDPSQVYKVINLGFSDGTVVKVISEHGFWDYDLNKFVYLRQDASKYLGHWFNKGETKVQLTSVDVRDEYTIAYSPVTYGHLCYYVNGMLSMPGGIEGLFNIFEVDPDTMTVNLEAMQRDISQYGLYTYDEFVKLVPVSEEVFAAFNGQYLKVAVGKGMITVEQINDLAVRYAQFFA